MPIDQECAPARSLDAGGEGARYLGLDEGQIRSALDDGLRVARREGRSVLASIVRRVPPQDALTFFARGAQMAADRFLWLRPSDGYAMAGVGAAWAVDVEGSGRFAEAAAAWRDRCAGAVVDAPADTAGVGPVLMGGFSFDPLRPPTARWDGYPDGRLVLPRYLLTSTGRSTWLTVNTVLWPDSDAVGEVRAIVGVGEGKGERGKGKGAGDSEFAAADRPAIGDSRPPTADPRPLSADEWKAIVRSLAAELRGGALEKVVLARECRVQGRRRFDPVQVLQRLRANYPSCFVFAVARGDRCFLGATPERLVRLGDGEVRATCLAGSIARGATEEADRRLGAALLASAKERSEHAIVVRALHEAMVDVCAEVAPVQEPVLMKVRNVQHLCTPLVGRVAGGRTILELVERFHPTPAVGGSPREAALRLIRQREGLDRGWYAGPIGWLAADGDGEFGVAIRSALLRGAEASLFAGCGIVAESDPESEYAESCLKLRPVLSALGETAS